MKSHGQSHPPYGVAIGLAAGMFVGVGLAIWLSPRLASELRERISGSAERIGRRASEHYEQASSRALDTVEGLTRPRAL